MSEQSVSFPATLARELDLDAETVERLADAWVRRNNDQTGYWPGEPIEMPGVLRVVCDCGQHVVYDDMVIWSPNGYREVSTCLDCWFQGRPS